MDKFCNYMLPVCILQSDGNVVASFDRRGQFIITGNSRGKVSKLFYKSFYNCIYHIG